MRLEYRKFYRLASKVPSVPGQLPILGLANRVFLASGEDIFKLMREIFSPIGQSPRKAWLTPAQLLIVVDDIEQLKKVYTIPSCVNRPNLYSAFMAPTGLLSSNGNLWKNHRKLLNPAFNAGVLKSFLPILNKKTQILIKVLDEYSNGNEFDISTFMASFSMDNILSTSLGFHGDSQTDKQSKLLQNFLGGMFVITKKITNFWLQYKPIIMLTKYYELEKQHITNGIHKFVKDFVDEKEKTFDISDISDKPQIFIDQLFKKRSEFNRNEIEDEIGTIVGTGYETSAYSLSLGVVLLALHPKIQEKLYDELKNVFRSANEEVSEDNLPQLTYLDLVVKEILRYWPPVSVIVRYTSDEVEIGDYLIPKETNIIIPIYEIHRNKKFWGDDADEFKPERFEGEKFKNVPAYAYMPFALGPRNCIGLNYATRMIKTTLAYFFRHFRVETDMKLEDISLEFVVVTKIVEGFKVKLTRRNFDGDS
ncbi:CLUMA_CG004694, isoform A [Clunio marinus]|uniref:CLUMA_CG004694, isoform A n=1 Tax=Clunio marinus TaxID=568069 RepID=A0A1J1HWV1_9DIPT|nr:CLUMA_CG004694, isoform A [Clunio marinus]